MTSAPSVSPEISKESGFDSFKRIIRQSGPLFLKTFIPIFLTLLLSTVICALGLTLILPNSDWAQIVLRPELQALQDRIHADASYELTALDKSLNFQQLSLYFQSLLTKIGFEFVTPLVLLFGSTIKLNSMLSSNKKNSITWIKSFKAPLKSGKTFLTGLFLFLFLVLLIPIGLVIAYLPGIFIMVLFFFSIHSLLLDDKIGVEVFRGGLFYARENIVKLILLLLIGVFLPLGLTELLQNQIKPALFGNDLVAVYESWLDPLNRNYGMLFYYFFVETFISNLAYLWLPTLWASAFFEIKQQKLKILSVKKTPAPLVGNVRTMEISADQSFYHCSTCGQKLPLSAKKCHQCGQLYRLIVKR